MQRPLRSKASPSVGTTSLAPQSSQYQIKPPHCVAYGSIMTLNVATERPEATLYCLRNRGRHGAGHVHAVFLLQHVFLMRSGSFQ
ncbi:hypothetical protein J6590_071111 [Homalodisca vitripennis]|nr:hypothetical protein J6590_071111 [Homalodisca vitripennis]